MGGGGVVQAKMDDPGREEGGWGRPLNRTMSKIFCVSDFEAPPPPQSSGLQKYFALRTNYVAFSRDTVQTDDVGQEGGGCPKSHFLLGQLHG